MAIAVFPRSPLLPPFLEELFEIAPTMCSHPQMSAHNISVVRHVWTGDMELLIWQWCQGLPSGKEVSLPTSLVNHQMFIEHLLHAKHFAGWHGRYLEADGSPYLKELTM